MSKKRLILTTMFAILFSTTTFATDDDKCRKNCGDPEPPPIEIDVDADADANADAHARSESDADASSDADATADASNGDQSVTIQSDFRRAPAAMVTHGDSTASDQKVRSFSGGWLTGSAGVRWDATDKELRALRRADEMRRRGQIAAADELECGQKVIYKSVGGNPDDCYDILAGSNTNVNRTSYNRSYEQQLQDMQREIEMLREEQEQCDDKTDAAFRKCVSK